ncbi:serine hydrolase domain-containing protein [Streptomyces marispadix]|uniref:Beta-lactamase family protein n=1 Tax=Streptomyces marispadix TaxID=2922868 RepID=A0ABS9SUR6_9ACTN|nr:serine hydrolase domain-containing protein [Streptomyces marispadix]MCH6160023.1 beta-lactamase family protein [Streptomyces marispadix]
MADGAKLRHAPTAGHAGLCPAELAALRDELDLLPVTGWCSGAVAVAGRGPWIALEHATGWAVRYSSYDAEAGAGAELPRERWEPATPGTLFDLASLTKLFTAVAAMSQCERGTVALDREVALYVPEFGARGKERITVRQLLTHTSGLRPEIPFGGERDGGGLLAPLWDEEPVAAPGSTHCYSDLNLIALQQVLERVSGIGLDALVRDSITGPLGMESTSYGPVPAASAAATEDQRRPWAKADRGMLRGTVHDENAFALGGVAGHAGLFSTAADLAVLCRTLLSGGAYGGARILTPSSVRAMLAPPGLGLAVGQPRFMGELAGGSGELRSPEHRTAAGHTGFTGTSLVLDPATDTFLVLLANTVHPVRRPADNRPRAEAATRLARAARSGAP